MSTKLAPVESAAAPQYEPAVPASLVIQDGADYTEWGERLKAIKSFQRDVAAWFAPMKAKAHSTWLEICDKERKALQPAITDEARIKRALADYSAEQDRIRREEIRIRQEEQRALDEQRRLEEAAALEREASATGNESLRDAATQLIEAPIALAPVVPMTPAAPTVEGLSFREVWKFTIVDASLLPRQFLMPNEKAIRSVVMGLKGRADIPGVRVWCEKEPAVRTR